MPEIVKILIDEDGLKPDQVWHVVDPFGDSKRVLCDGMVFGEGEGSAVFQTKIVKYGGIQCASCKEMVEYFKSFHF